MNKFLPEEDVTVLLIAEVQQDREKTKTDANIWHRVYRNESLNIVKPTWLEVFQCQTELTKHDHLRQASSGLKRAINLTARKLQIP